MSLAEELSRALEQRGDACRDDGCSRRDRSDEEGRRRVPVLARRRRAADQGVGMIWLCSECTATAVWIATWAADEPDQDHDDAYFCDAHVPRETSGDPADNFVRIGKEQNP